MKTSYFITLKIFFLGLQWLQSSVDQFLLYEQTSQFSSAATYSFILADQTYNTLILQILH